MKTIKMEAVDTVQITSVRAEPLVAGDKFDIDETQAKSLEERGLAKIVATAKAAKSK